MWHQPPNPCATHTPLARWSTVGFAIFFAAGLAITLIYILLESGVVLKSPLSCCCGIVQISIFRVAVEFVRRRHTSSRASVLVPSHDAPHKGTSGLPGGSAAPPTPPGTQPEISAATGLNCQVNNPIPKTRRPLRRSSANINSILQISQRTVQRYLAHTFASFTKRIRSFFPVFQRPVRPSRCFCSYQMTVAMCSDPTLFAPDK